MHILNLFLSSIKGSMTLGFCPFLSLSKPRFLVAIRGGAPEVSYAAAGPRLVRRRSFPVFFFFCHNSAAARGRLELVSGVF